MGGSQSKAKTRPRRNPARQVYYDEHGNLRLGNSSHHTEKELKKLVKLEAQGTEGIDEDADWFVVEVNWVNSWLAHVHFNKASPSPGPCRNHPLLVENEENTAFVPKPGISLATKSNGGDYRLVSEQMWKELCKFYPGSGPAIKTKFLKDEAHAADGLYDTSQWEIDQSSFTRSDALEHKKKKKAWFGGSGKGSGSTNAGADNKSASGEAAATAAGGATAEGGDSTTRDSAGGGNRDTTATTTTTNATPRYTFQVEFNPLAKNRKSEARKKKEGDDNNLEEWLFK